MCEHVFINRVYTLETYESGNMNGTNQYTYEIFGWNESLLSLSASHHFYSFSNRRNAFHRAHVLIYLFVYIKIQTTKMFDVDRVLFVN